MRRPIDVRERLPKAEDSLYGFVKGYFPALGWARVKAETLKETGAEYWMPLKEQQHAQSNL